MKFRELLVGACIIVLWVGLFAIATYLFFPDQLAELLLFMLFSNCLMLVALWLYVRSRKDKEDEDTSE